MRRCGLPTVWLLLCVATACAVEDRAISLPRDAAVDAAPLAGCDGGCRPDPACAATFAPPEGALSAWFDASCLPAGRLRRWTDRSAAQHDAQSPAEVASPEVIAGGLGGANAVHFDGVGQYFTLPDGTMPARNGSYTVIVAGSWDDIARTYNGVLAWGGAYGAHILVNPGGHMFQWWGFEMRANITAQVVFDASPRVLAYRYDSAGPSEGGRWSLFADGAEVLSAQAQVPNAVSSTTITIGRAPDYFPARNPMLGYIGEMFIYARALDDAEVGSVSAYLARKWVP